MALLHLLCMLLFCAASLSELLSQTELQVESPNTMIGHTETIHCLSRNGSLPITYTLFLNQTTVLQRMVTQERRAAFNITIDETRLGPYKCKANNSLKYSPYSAGFTYILEEQLEKPDLKVESVYTMIGRTETIHCVCSSGSLPITYTLFLNQTTVGRRTVTQERRAAFNVTIDETRLGPYKCKANNSLKYSPYSAGFTYILEETFQINLVPRSLYTMIGRTETIHCVCSGGSLPMTYTLMLNETTVCRRTVTQESGVTFNVTIYDETRLGPYKCEANNSLKCSPYSAGFTYILEVQKTQHGYLAWLIPILILTGILVIVVYITLTRRKKGDDGAEDQDVTYSKVMVGRGRGSTIKMEEAVEYVQVSKKKF